DVYRLGAIKLHPPHMEMAANAYRTDCPSLADVYRLAGEAKRPVLIHTGTSIFPGARNVYADPMACDDVAVDFPGTTLVLCHAGRPLWYETAFFLARRHPNVLLDISGIPPRKLLEVLPRISEIRDKYSGEVIGEVQEDTRRDLRAKIHRAFQVKGAVRGTSFEQRAELGRRIALRLGGGRAELEELMVREGGQPRKFARWEMDRAIASAASLERRLELLNPRELPAASGRNFLTREPYGVVGVLPPRNTPLVVPLYTMLCALGAGNSVVEKPSSLVPLICQRLVQHPVEAGCPADSVQISTCPGEDAAWEFIENPEVDVLVHYASSPVGKDNLIKMGSYLERTKKTLGECMLHVGGRMKKYVPELAGNDPFIVLESADLAQAAAAGLLGGFAHSGQLCIAAKRFLVQRSIAMDFRERLVEGIRRLKVGDPRDEETDIG